MEEPFTLTPEPETVAEQVTSVRRSAATCSAFASPTMNAMAAPGGDPKKIDYPTPLDWFTYLNLEFGFTLDPCCAHGTAKCKKYYTEEDDGLNKSWADERVFMNPPYGRHLGPWMQKAYEESKRGALVVCFVPARVDTNWWHDFAIKGEVRLPKGRVKNPGGGAWPFPVAVVIFRPRLHSLPNADVDLPDTAAQDSASKSNSTAVSG